MKLFDINGKPDLMSALMVVALVFAVYSKVADAADINDDIRSYRQDVQSRQGIGSSTDYSAMRQRDSDRAQRDYERNDRDWHRFMDNEYGSQTPNPSCYLCNGY